MVLYIKEEIAKEQVERSVETYKVRGRKKRSHRQNHVRIIFSLNRNYSVTIHREKDFSELGWHSCCCCFDVKLEALLRLHTGAETSHSHCIDWVKWIFAQWLWCWVMSSQLLVQCFSTREMVCIQIITYARLVSERMLRSHKASARALHGLCRGTSRLHAQGWAPFPVSQGVISCSMSCVSPTFSRMTNYIQLSLMIESCSNSLAQVQDFGLIKENYQLFWLQGSGIGVKGGSPPQQPPLQQCQQKWGFAQCL